MQFSKRIFISLKIDVRDQTVWKYGQELKQFHSIKMELKLAGSFFSKIHQMAIVEV